MEEQIRQAAAAHHAAQYQQHQHQHQHQHHHPESWRESAELQEMLQREMLHREALRRQQVSAAFMAGFPPGAAPPGHGGAGSSGGGNGSNSSLAAAQEAEYLQQLRLEALVQQRRQETLAQLALAQELGMSQDMQAMLEAEQIRQAALLRQEAFLASMGASGAYGSGAAAGGNASAESILGSSLGGLAAGNEEGILQILQERERQRKFAAMAQAQSAGSSSGVAAPSTHHHGMERADLIGSVFAKSASATSAAAGEEQERQLQQQHHQQQYNAAIAAAAAESKSAEKSASHISIPEEAVQDSKTTILPCRARGMPMDHNVKTAYFVIPEDIKHGTELVCSYFACRNAGIKFRYCVYCKLPVAKRNFAKRHRHMGKIAACDLPRDFEESCDDDLSTSEQGTATKGGAKAKGSPKPPMVSGKKTSVPASAVAPTVVAAVSARGPAKAKSKPQRIDAKELLDYLSECNAKEVQEGDAPVKEPFSEQLLETLIKERKEAWDNLFLKRPKSNKDMSAIVAWVQDVLRVSDMEEAAASLTPDASSQLKKTDSPRKDVLAISAKEERKKEDDEDDDEKSDGVSLVKNNENITKDEPNQLKEKEIAEKNEKPKKEEEEQEDGEITEAEKEKRPNDDEDDDEEEGEVLVDGGDDGSTSSEDSVDLRASKKARMS